MTRIIPGLMVAGALIGACDEGDGGSDFEFRRGECIGTGVVVSTSPTMKSPGMPNPLDDDIPLPLTENHLERIKSNTMFALSAAFVAQDENAATCDVLCAENDLEWGGQGCVYDGDIVFGDAEPLDATEEHPAMMMVPVEADAEMGCACQ